LSPSITSNLSLSLNQLSPTTRSKKEKKYKSEEEENPNLQLEERKPSLLADLLVSQVSAGIFIGRRRFQKMRQDHALKIDACQDGCGKAAIPRFCDLTRDLGP